MFIFLPKKYFTRFELVSISVFKRNFGESFRRCLIFVGNSSTVFDPHRGHNRVSRLISHYVEKLLSPANLSAYQAVIEPNVLMLSALQKRFQPIFDSTWLTSQFLAMLKPIIQHGTSWYWSHQTSLSAQEPPCSRNIQHLRCPFTA
jgi:hypothetical protein